MYVKIIQARIDERYTAEFGYDMPDVITDTAQIPPLEVKVLFKDPEDPTKAPDIESTEYKQMVATAQCLKAGFEIGCSYTQRLFAQMAERAANEETLQDVPANTDIKTKPIIV